MSRMSELHAETTIPDPSQEEYNLYNPDEAYNYVRYLQVKYARNRTYEQDNEIGRAYDIAAMAQLRARK